MASNKNVLMLPGDGIGPEVMAEVRRVMDWMGNQRGVGFDVEEDLVGGCAYEKHGVALADETMDKAQEADAVLLGAVGGPAWDDLDFSLKPERGLLRLRKEMDLYANLRPAIVFDALVEASTLKPEIVEGLDILIIRELTAGVYFGEPRGIEELPDGRRRGVNTQVFAQAAHQCEHLLSGGAHCPHRHYQRVHYDVMRWNAEISRAFDDFFGHCKTYFGIFGNTGIIV